MSRLGLFRAKIEKRQDDLGLDASGFRLDGSDPEGATKEAMLARLYRRADQHLPPGIGGVPSTENVDTSDPSPNGDTPP